MDEDFKTLSRRLWKAPGDITVEQISAGALLRIADALEIISKNYSQLLNDKEFYKSRYENERMVAARQQRRISALKGVITRGKNNR